MHRSRLSGFVIDCHTGDLEDAPVLRALGMSARQDDEAGYLQLNSSAHGLNVLVSRWPMRAECTSH